MFYSLVQTLVCVLLINGGLYALHLKGNGGGGETSSMSAAAGGQMQMLGPAHAKQSASVYDSSGRLSEELADLAQLERERLMLLGIAKQTAAANAAAATGHHGRPIITGRIHMSPTEDVVGDGDYGGLLMSPARGYMFGHVVKQPTTTTENENLALAAEFTGGGVGAASATIHPAKYEYGRLVQPAVEPAEYEAAAHIPLDLDAFMELEQEPETADDDDFDLDGYQYLDELLAEQQQHDWQEKQNQQRGINPYYTLEELEADAPLALRELFNKEPHKTQQQSQLQLRNGMKPSNIRLQQKWQRKRAQQQLPLQRNIFGQKKRAQQQHTDLQEPQTQSHFFNQRHHSQLSLANSEATASKKDKNKHGDEKTTNENTLAENIKSAVNTIRNHNNLQQQQQQQQQQLSQMSALTNNYQNNNNNNNKLDLKQSILTAALTPASSLKQNQAIETQPQQQQSAAEEKLLVHPNHKRSGSSGLMPSALSAAGTHSIASQLMLRTARGQRQYDVPQIGK